jgi:regulator of sigma E protease
MGPRIFTIVKEEKGLVIKFLASDKLCNSIEQWKDRTKYSWKLFPIGGSCMMLGEDEIIEDKNAFNKKGVWARFSVIFAGAFFNFVFAFILALIFIGDAGVDKPFVNEVKQGSSVDGKLQVDDVITKINGSPIHFSKEVDYYFYFNPLTEKPVNITYMRNGKEKTTKITPEWQDYYQIGCSYSQLSEKAKLDEVAKGLPLDLAGAVAGDVIVNVDGTEIASAKELANYFNLNPLTGKEVEITYLQGGDVNKSVTKKITPKLVSSNYVLNFNYNSYREKVSAFNVVKYSFYELKFNFVNTIKSLFYLVTGKISTREISGPVGIVNVFDKVVNDSKAEGLRVTVLRLISLSILISANLGVINLLPVPAMDGGRLVFLLIEAIRRKPVPKEKEAMVHMVGMALLMLLMVFVLFNDIRNIFAS